MARPHLRRKLAVYRCLYHINRRFAEITSNLYELGKTLFLDPDQMHAFREYARELQSEINHNICMDMRAVEEKDWFGYGQTRIHREHYLNPNRPAFHQKPPEPPKDAPEK